jgi:multidrug efflux pump
VISAFNSLTLSPALSALLLKGHDAPKDWLTRGMDRVLGGFFARFNRFFGRSLESYGRRDRVIRARAGARRVRVLLVATWGVFQMVPAASCRRRTSST